MKNNIIILLSFGFLFSGCNDFLDRTPYNEIDSKIVYSSADMAESAVVGVYSNLMYDYTSAALDRLNWDAFSSVMDPYDACAYSNYQYLLGTIQSNNSAFLTYWKRFYEGVNRANDVINNIGNTPDMTDAIKDRRMAECRFLRAYHYYRLNSLWRGVPIYLENLSPSEYVKGRSSEEDVWNTILDDLTYCINSENLPGKYASNSSDFGRITKGAAYALRGKVYLWMHRWADAEKDFRKVGELGYKLLNKPYADLFKLANEKCDEMIFSVGMENQEGQGNVFSSTYGSWPVAGKGGNNTFFMNTNFVNSYEWANGKPFNWDDIFPGYSSMDSKARSVFFLRNNMTEVEKKQMQDYGADMSQYESDSNEARILAAYTNRDPRLAATVITPYSTYVGGFYGKEETFCYKWPYRTDRAPYYDLQTKSNSFMLYPIRKYVTVGMECKNELYNPVDVPVIRYADVLLDLAEALNEQDNLDEAVVYVNMVRKRAGIAELNEASNDYVKVTDKDDLRQRIMNERRWELAGEEQLYYDELRCGTWKDSKFSEKNGLQEVWGTNVYEYKWGGDEYKLWPIPSSETEKNKKIIQNKGWN